MHPLKLNTMLRSNLGLPEQRAEYDPALANKLRTCGHCGRLLNNQRLEDFVASLTPEAVTLYLRLMGLAKE